MGQPFLIFQTPPERPFLKPWVTDMAQTVKGRDAFMREIRAALDDVARSYAEESSPTWGDGGWTARIKSEVATRLKAPERSLVTSPEGCVVWNFDELKEWVFDFCVVSKRILVERTILHVAAEIEWNDSLREIDRDFAKLLIVDCELCFFCFQAKTQRDADPHIQRLSTEIAVRQEVWRRTRADDPPGFLLSCCIYGERAYHYFLHYEFR